jgi:hypothetical protein
VERNPPRHRPGRDIAIVVAAKTIALVLLYALFFGPAQRVAVDAESFEARLTAPEATAADRVRR